MLIPQLPWWGRQGALEHGTTLIRDGDALERPAALQGQPCPSPRAWQPEWLPLRHPPSFGLRDWSLWQTAPPTSPRGELALLPGAPVWSPSGPASLRARAPLRVQRALARQALQALVGATCSCPRPQCHLCCFPTDAAGLCPRQGPDLTDDPLKVGTEPASGGSPAQGVFAVVLTTVCSPACVTDAHSRGAGGACWGHAA